MGAVLIQQAAFQVVWFACALGAGSERSWPGVAAAVCFISANLLRSSQRSRDLLLIAGAVALGSIVDTVLVGGGFVAYVDSGWRLGVSPAWTLALWGAFAVTVPKSYSWLLGRPLLAATLGGTGGALAYAAGARLGALSVLDPSGGSWTAIALAWAAALPAIVWAQAQLPARGEIRGTPRLSRQVYGSHSD